MHVDSFAVIVNDEQTQLVVLAGLARKAGLEPQSFTDAESALASMMSLVREKETLPAIVVTDLNMPGIDGWHFCRLLRSREYLPLNNIPIAIVSATFSGNEPAHIAAAFGVEAFLPMPVEGENFVRLIKNILERKDALKPLRALVVEADAVWAGHLKERFDSQGYLADTTLTGTAAVEMLDRVGYDLAVIDDRTTGDAGAGLIGAITRDRPDCVVIMTSDHPDPELAVRWMKQGVAAHIHKPYAAEYLIEQCGRARRERALMRTQEKLDGALGKLLDDEQLHRGILHTAMDGYWLSDSKGRLLEVNEAYCRMSGYDEQELLSMTIADLDDVESAEAVLAHKEKVKTLRADRFETRHRRKDKSVYDVEVSTHYLPVGGGLFVSFLHDVSERKHSMQTLVDSERKWRNILADAPQIGVGFNRQGKITLANNHLLQLTGWAEADVIGRDWFDMFVPESIRSRIRQVFLSVIETNDVSRIGRYENEIMTRKGELLQVDWANTVTLDGQGHIVEVVSLGIDLTERRRSQEALRKSEERLRLALDGADLGIWDWNIQGKEVVYNDRWAEMAGYSLGEIEPNDEIFFGLVHPDDQPAVRETIQRHLKGESPSIDIEFRMRHKSGGWICVLNRGQVIERDAGGNALRACGTHLDITGRKKAQEEKEKLGAQLLHAQKMEFVGRLAGGVAHDFNNMLGVILGRTEIAFAFEDATGRYAPHLREIQKAAQRSADLTRQLLAFARKQTIAPKVLDLNENVEGMLKMLRRLMGEDIDLVWRPDPSSPRVKLDPSQLDQILANLCVNARDAIAGTGVVAIATGAAFFEEEHCPPGAVPGEYALLSVGDDGCGMDEETLQNVFEPFFTTKEEGRGTGLGLATVYGIVQQNGGFIDAHSRPGEGTTFGIYLPRCDDPSGQPSELPSLNPITGGTETVLLVEDDTANLEIVTALLQGLGYTVFPASTPTEAIERAKEHADAIDLLLTDVIMPQMNGRDLSRIVLGHCPRVKLLFMSGYTADVMARGGVIDAGIPFIQKPFSLAALAGKIREALGKGAEQEHAPRG